MNEAFRQALGGLLKGDEGLRAGFGLERRTTAGPPIPPDAFCWEESLTVQGNGNIALKTRRSIADVSAEPIGEFQSAQGKDVVMNLVRLVLDSGLDVQPPFRVEPTDVQVRLGVIVGGITHASSIGMRDPAALAPLRPLLQQLDRLAAEARKYPVISLALQLERPPAMTAGRMEIPVDLSFVNTGLSGFWITHPSTLASRDASGATTTEHCGFLCGRRPDPQPGITPLPMALERSPLVAAAMDGKAFLWVPPSSRVSIRFTAAVGFPSTGTYVARAVFSSYQGDDSLGGQPRLRGCVFSNEVTLPVG